MAQEQPTDAAPGGVGAAAGVVQVVQQPPPPLLNLSQPQPQLPPQPHVGLQEDQVFLVVASLIAQVTYQAGISPPASMWKDKMSLDLHCFRQMLDWRWPNLSKPLDECPTWSFLYFMACNTAGFISAILLIFFHKKEKYRGFLLMLSVTFLLIGYFAVVMMSSRSFAHFLILLAVFLAVFLIIGAIVYGAFNYLRLCQFLQRKFFLFLPSI